LHVHDPRHRYSYELRPDAELDQAIREIALRLEQAGALAPGLATAPRFHPHLTLLRSGRCDEQLVVAIADLIAPAPALTFKAAGSFGAGRIGWLQPLDGSSLVAARDLLVRELGEEHVDPLALARDPWIPHLTAAYAVEPEHRDDIEQLLAAHLPLTGAWALAQSWDLAVRPTVLVAEQRIAALPARMDRDEASA
jgi:2'-5' RNA ligase